MKEEYWKIQIKKYYYGDKDRKKIMLMVEELKY